MIQRFHFQFTWMQGDALEVQERCSRLIRWQWQNVWWFPCMRVAAFRAAFLFATASMTFALNHRLPGKAYLERRIWQMKLRAQKCYGADGTVQLVSSV